MGLAVSFVFEYGILNKRNVCLFDPPTLFYVLLPAKISLLSPRSTMTCFPIESISPAELPGTWVID